MLWADLSRHLALLAPHSNNSYTVCDLLSLFSEAALGWIFFAGRRCREASSFVHPNQYAVEFLWARDVSFWSYSGAGLTQTLQSLQAILLSWVSLYKTLIGLRWIRGPFICCLPSRCLRVRSDSDSIQKIAGVIGLLCLAIVKKLLMEFHKAAAQTFSLRRVYFLGF